MNRERTEMGASQFGRGEAPTKIFAKMRYTKLIRHYKRSLLSKLSVISSVQNHNLCPIAKG